MLYEVITVLNQLMTESGRSWCAGTILMIWPASMDPSRVTNPAATIITARKTSPVASPRRMPRAAIQLTAGSTARARKKAMRMLISRPMSW
ncbi:hypothetical protein TU94_24420 [Streptomyces cyaneogriseus subsp. noncyanogenus]|uniref:Uncharacterized protein n=1 Tax=Streptomyces cyaneogriseus subsp. noncyanogenus TaxID=477245 RepID=A0A0C5GI56_9ACTN|nr:hypothetical protein TU94_24420 [Streptomyces cyaneogriseus subsp. noncyanogenus]